MSVFGLFPTDGRTECHFRDTSDLSMNVGSEKKKKTEIRKAMNDIISCRDV
jgi:hypothetical protein